MRRRYYKKGYKKKRWNYGRFMTNAGKTAATAYTALRVAKQVKNLINVEFKSHDKTQVLQDALDTGTVVCLNEIPQGDTDNQRDGITSMLKSIDLKINCTNNANINTSIVRCILLIDHDNINDTLPNVTDIIQNATILSPKNRDNMTRFTFLWDKRFTLSGDGTEIKYAKYYKKCSKKMWWRDDAAEIPRKNALLLLWMSNRSTDNYPTFSYYSRLRYLDN